MTNQYKIITRKFCQLITNQAAAVRNMLPRCCLLCNEQTSHYQNKLCDVCRSDLPFPVNLCIGCATLLMNAQKWCGQCQKNQPQFPLVAACYYQTPVKELLNALKYRHQMLVAHELARNLARRISLLLAQGMLERPQVIIPVPLHWRRQFNRGYNQSEIIANELGAYFKLPVINIIKRVKSTVPQTNLNGQQRQHNLNDAFNLIQSVNYQSIAIVDDVYTTGATMREISTTLLKQQHINIQHWVIARTSIS